MMVRRGYCFIQNGHPGEFGEVVGSELAFDVAPMCGNRSQGDAKPGGDFLGGEARPDQPQNFDLAAAQYSFWLL